MKRKFLDTELIKKLYLEHGLGAPEIAERLQKKSGSVKSVIHRLGIARSREEAMRIAREHGRWESQIGCKSPVWKGGRTKRKGYTLIMQPSHHRAYDSGYVLEHILVWEEYHQKLLPKGWEIHHVNGIKTDNRPENLLALPSRKHRLIIPKLKERIRQLEIENRQLRRAFEDSQGIFYIGEN